LSIIWRIAVFSD